jgi:hypothetical protein
MGSELSEKAFTLTPRLSLTKHFPLNHSSKVSKTSILFSTGRMANGGKRNSADWKRNPKKEDKTRGLTTTTQRKNKHIDY